MYRTGINRDCEIKDRISFDDILERFRTWEIEIERDPRTEEEQERRYSKEKAQN